MGGRGATETHAAVLLCGGIGWLWSPKRLLHAGQPGAPRAGQALARLQLTASDPPRPLPARPVPPGLRCLQPALQYIAGELAVHEGDVLPLVASHNTVRSEGGGGGTGWVGGRQQLLWLSLVRPRRHSCCPHRAAQAPQPPALSGRCATSLAILKWHAAPPTTCAAGAHEV